MLDRDGNLAPRVPVGGIVIAHPVKQHAYEVALALQNAGWLREFITGIYFRPTAFPFALINGVPPVLRSRLLRQLEKRRHPELRADLIRSWPYAELLSQITGHGIDRLLEERLGTPFVNWMSDAYVSRVIARMRPRAAAVYAFLDSARQTFERARTLRIPTILDVPIVVDAHAIVQQEYRRLGLKESLVPAESRAAGKEIGLADWVIAPSPAVADSVRRAGFAGRGIFVVPFGADTTVFRPGARPVRPGRFRVVFAGTLFVRKGVHYLLEAWRAAGLAGELVLAGPPGDNQEFVSRIRRQYGGLFVEAGNLSPTELAHLFSTSDVFVLPSLAEGSALVTYQALASGLPSIVTREAGSVVRDGIEGFVIPARDTGALRDRLERLFCDHELRQRMARAALARSGQFTWHHYHRELASAVAHMFEREASSPAVLQTSAVADHSK